MNYSIYIVFLSLSFVLESFLVYNSLIRQLLFPVMLFVHTICIRITIMGEMLFLFYVNLKVSMLGGSR